MFNLAVLALVVATAYLVALDVTGPLRSMLVIASVFLLPGTAIVSRLGLDDGHTFLALTLVTSIATIVVAATLMVWADWWHPFVLGSALAVVCSVVLLADVVRITRSLDPAEPASTTSAWD